ncbi:MAG: adenosine kinase [Alphaproteobacteria bacterium]|nr:MAG: adenosine kinase [Alphaproteobacteria bacterium]
MTDNKKYDVVAIGNAMLDVLCEVSEPFLDQEGISKGVMNLVSRERSNNILKLVKPVKETAGGSAANTISTLAKLGLKTGYIGKIADDQQGGVFKKDLIHDSIIYKTAFLDKGNSESTGKCIVLITPDKERTMNTYLGATEYLSDIDIDEELIAYSEWLYLEGYRFDGQESKKAFYKAIEIAKKNKTKIAITLSDSFCVDRHRSDFINLLNESADLVFCNEDELKSLYEVEYIEAAQKLIADTISCVACTCAEKGAYLFHKSSIRRISTKKVSVIDTTGAGDNFASGFLYGLSKNFSLEKCAVLGNEIAGEVLTIYGPRIEKSLTNFIKVNA